MPEKQVVTEIDNPEAEKLREAIRVALPYLDAGPYRSEDYDGDNCRRVHLDFIAGLSMAASHLEREAGLRLPPPERPRRKIVYAASFVDSYMELTGMDRRAAIARLRERGEVEGDLRPVSSRPTEEIEETVADPVADSPEDESGS